MYLYRYLRLISFSIKFKVLIVHSSGLEWAGCSTVKGNYKNKKAYTHMQKAPRKNKFPRNSCATCVISKLRRFYQSVCERESEMHYSYGKCTCLAKAITVDLQLFYICLFRDNCRDKREWVDTHSIQSYVPRQNLNKLWRYDQPDSFIRHQIRSISLSERQISDNYRLGREAKLFKE